MRATFWIVLLLASALVAVYTTWVEGALGQPMVTMYILGKALAHVAIPALVTLVVVLAGKLFKHPPLPATQVGIAAIVWILLIITSIVGTSYQGSFFM